MTVIAWDGKTLAADRQCTSGAVLSEHTKLSQVSDGSVLAFWGPIRQWVALIRWYEAGAKPEEWPKDADDNGLIVVTVEGSVTEYEGCGWPIACEQNKAAWGGGREFALGAMAAGASALQAVQIANQHHAMCGCGTDHCEVLK